ncbi:MAG: hemerythrin domain-containing protein [Candidatus Yanofskybacteria bacterium]|nr:hemerythrin domain-containing protein [Candidatus Yanofskybacteria bacterium]
MANKLSPVEMIKQDHRRVEQLFEKFESAGENFEERRSLADEICSALEVHAQMEEEIFYPALAQADEEKYQALVEESMEEHAQIKKLIEDIRMLDAQDDAESFTAKMTVLKEDVLLHAKEEEKELLPDAEETLSDDTKEIGEEMSVMKEKLMESMM